MFFLHLIIEGQNIYADFLLWYSPRFLSFRKTAQIVQKFSGLHLRPRPKRTSISLRFLLKQLVIGVAWYVLVVVADSLFSIGLWTNQSQHLVSKPIES